MSNRRTKIKDNQKTNWVVSTNQTSTYSKVANNNVNTKYKSKIVALEKTTHSITDSYLFTLIPIMLFSLITIILFYLLSIDILTIENFGVRTTINEKDATLFPLLKIVTLISLILAFTKFRNSNRMLIILVWISFLASFFSSRIGDKDFYLITSLVFVCLMPVLFGINELRRNPPVKEKYNILTKFLILISFAIVITSTILGGYQMNWVTPENNAHINNEYLVILTVSFFLMGIMLMSLKRPSGVMMIWFGILFSTITNGIDGYYMEMITGVILLPIIALMFVEWENMRFSYRKANK